MNQEFFEALDLIEKEKGIPKSYMMERIEAALLSAYRRDCGTDENVFVDINEEKRSIRMYRVKTVAEEVQDPENEISLDEARKISKKLKVGDKAEIDIKTKDFGRISAQTAKQVIIQGIREAERDMAYEEYNSKEGEILTGVVLRNDPRNGNIVVEIGKNEAVLLSGEQVPGEKFADGERIKVYVVEVRRATRGLQLIISRTHPGLVKRLLELEVPEIYEGTVEIKAISREAGSRTKIAVLSKDENVDPVGSCIGARGSRVGAIVSELKGEKIDIIKYSEDPAAFVAAALSPSEVISVEIIGENACRAIVPDDQLSLAIGKEGQNARLAARLTGWKIDIRPLSEMGKTKENEE